MPETPKTPGQIAYEAYSRIQRTGQPPRPPTPYERLQEVTRDAWEAAAQAVQAMENEEREPGGIRRVNQVLNAEFRHRWLRGDFCRANGASMTREEALEAFVTEVNDRTKD